MFALNTPAPVSALNLLNLSTIVEPNGPVYNGPGATKHFTPFHLRQLEYHQREAIERAKKYAMEQSIRAVLLKQTQSQQSQQLDNMKKNQTVALLNRVYVGSISYDVKEEMLKQSFSVFGPIKTVSMSWDPATQKHKGFAFLEFEYPEGAHLAIEQMNGTSFGGRQLKVGRPSNLASADPIIAELVAEYKLENRIYVSGIHLDLTEDDVSLVFEAFGKIVFCRLQPDPSRPIGHRGFGYIEYENGQSAMDAVASMNQFELGGQLLRVCKAISPPDGITSTTTSALPPAAAVAAASVTAKVMSMETEQVRFCICASDFTSKLMEKLLRRKLFHKPLFSPPLVQ
ncbi:PolyU binding splicing factor PUF60 [Fasciola hepatica]|uniref:PolyU binding splicing factor PUF60 n=1 Tax=Fasciola hepatica TaxID=6192 RepID=A0A2H1BSL1_FASHE|nr:PolyU binding splicing factor PUF60 [Fasciola hepatica]